MQLKTKRLSISLEFLPLAALCFVCLLYEPKVVALCLVSAVFHELGHIAAALLCGVKSIKIKAEVFSFNIERTSVGLLCFWRNIAVLSGGIFANALIVIVSILLSKVYDSDYLPIIFFINLSQQIINILPIRPLDGGNIVELLLLELLPYDKALYITEIIEKVFLALALIALLVYFTVCKCFNLTMLLFWLVLCFSRLQALHLGL